MTAKRGLALGAALLLATLTLNVGVSGASVDDSTPNLQVRSIDARDGKVVVDYMYHGRGDGRSAKLVVGGKTTTQQATPLTEAGMKSSVAVVIDNSNAVSNATVQLAKEDLVELSPGNGAIADLAVVSTGDGAKTVAQPATSIGNVTSAFDAIIPMGQSSLWDGMVMAAGLLRTTGSTQRNVVLVVASADSASIATYSNMLVALRAADASVHVIAMTGSSADGSALRELVERMGGSFQVGTDQDFRKLYRNVATLIGGQYRATVTGVAGTRNEFADLSLTVGKEKVLASYRPDVLNVGAEEVKPAPIIADASVGFFGSDIVKYLIVALVALGAAGGFFAVANLITKRRDGLKYALRHYDESYGATSVEEDDDQSLAKSALLQRAVEVTGNIAEERGFLVRVEHLLERADLPLRPAEALTFYLGGALASVVIAFVLTGNIMMAAGVVLLALIAPGFVVDFLAKRRKKKFNQLLPDMLQLLAGTLRAGYSIGQGFEAVSGEIQEPMGKELRRAVTEARLGRPLDEALEAVAFRMDSEDFGWAVMAIRIQREVGGNLAELLMTVSDTMTQRERLRRDVASLTAEGRMSAIILGLLPPGLGVAMWVMNPEYISKLFSGTGLILLVASIFMMLVGFVWMKKTITIEV
ncbi:MAG: type II secretion system F family protein [Acidimicrobiales bacterium]